jgi:hypothetical protein
LSLSLDQLKALRMTPTKEEMASKWFFPEAGKAEKELVGVPYPIRHLEASVTLSDGQVITGHVYTTSVFVSGAYGVRRFVLSLRQHGKEGESFESLVYVAEIVVDDVAPAAPRADAAGPETPADDEAATGAAAPSAVDAELLVMALPGLFGLPGELDESGASFSFRALPGNKHVFALRSGGTIRVGWPAGKDDSNRTWVSDFKDNATYAWVSDTLGDVKDFFDSRELLGAFRDDADDSIYALILLSRRGKTTNVDSAGRPWRLEVWRWLSRQGDDRAMLAGRGVFFRGLADADGTGMPSVLPAVIAPIAAPPSGEGAAVSLSVKDIFGEDALFDGE